METSLAVRAGAPDRLSVADQAAVQEAERGCGIAEVLVSRANLRFPLAYP